MCIETGFWYEKEIELRQTRRFALDILPNRDETEIGEKVR